MSEVYVINLLVVVVLLHPRFLLAGLDAESPLDI